MNLQWLSWLQLPPRAGSKVALYKVPLALTMMRLLGCGPNATMEWQSSCSLNCANDHSEAKYLRGPGCGWVAARRRWWRPRQRSGCPTKGGGACAVQAGAPSRALCPRPRSAARPQRAAAHLGMGMGTMLLTKESIEVGLCRCRAPPSLPPGLAAPPSSAPAPAGAAPPPPPLLLLEPAPPLSEKTCTVPLSLDTASQAQSLEKASE